jgi:hypothetical protein
LDDYIIDMIQAHGGVKEIVEHTLFERAILLSEKACFAADTLLLHAADTIALADAVGGVICS